MSVTVEQAVLLGFVQGLTEFLPVSSSAHLALVQYFLPGFAQPGLLFDVLLHLGTLVAVVVYFRKRIAEVLTGFVSAEPERRRASLKLAALLCLAVLATGLVTLPLKGLAEEGMVEFRRIGAALLAMSLLMTIAQRVGRLRGEAGRPLSEVRFRDALLIGLLQSISAVFHGFSRSGNTISVGLFTGMSRQTAAEFSFLLSIPTILAAVAVELLDALKDGAGTLFTASNLTANAAGLVVAAVVGYASVALLFRLVVAMRLLPFILYTGALGLILLLVPLGRAV